MWRKRSRTMAGALAAADRVFEVLDLASEEGDRPGEVPARFEQRIEYRGVSFSYNGQAPVLEGLDFEVRRGQVVAVVGPSGAGKTTLVDLLPRFYEPKRGAILMDGVPITRFTRTSLRGLMGIVSQETILLNDTVLANISYGRSDFTLEQVQAAARAANAHDFVSQLPEGYRTLLGERGTRLSGGERQRIAIARALLRDPPILILDEATSALDMESERLVQEAIDRLMARRTTFVIAHRLATVQHADLILVLAEGRIVERGTHATLYAAGGLYRRLHDMQFRTSRDLRVHHRPERGHARLPDRSGHTVDSRAVRRSRGERRQVGRPHARRRRGAGRPKDPHPRQRLGFLARQRGAVARDQPRDGRLPW